MTLTQSGMSPCLMVLLPTASPTLMVAEIIFSSVSSCSSSPTLPPLNGAANELFLLLSLYVSIAYISFPSSPTIPQTPLVFSVISLSWCLFQHYPPVPQKCTLPPTFSRSSNSFSASEENCQLWQYFWALFLSLGQNINSVSVVYSYKAIIFPAFPSDWNNRAGSWSELVVPHETLGCSGSNFCLSMQQPPISFDQ